ncbi:uncharacterized protein LOC134236266 [Saccostrea cucullata]|uniref:uncharacterized protein LOC134236266 n=1 Tax=Saccostrea cuccullata TaxID=36930 RepID=UPI002ED5BC2D
MPAEISDLPNEVLLMIFSNLSFYDMVHSIKAVCSRWRDLGKRQCLWTTNGVIDWVKEASNLEDFLHRVRIIGRKLDTLSYGCSSSLAGDIEDLYSVQYGRSNEIEVDIDDEDAGDDLDGFDKPLVFLRQDIRIRCPNIKTIHVVQSDISLSNFLQLTEKYSSVTEVVIDRNVDLNIYNPERFMPALRKLANLTHLTVKCDERDNDQMDGIWESDRWNEELENLLRGHPNLTYLDVSLPGRCERTIERITKTCQKLKTLKMNGEIIILKDLDILPMKKMQLLEDLSLYDFRMMSRDFKSILTVACAGGRVEKLNLIECYDVAEATYQTVSEQCPLLRRFVGKEDKKFVTVKKKLDLMNGPEMYTFINDNALTYLSTCRHLQEISIGDSCGVAVTDEGIRTLARGCPQLKYANFEDCIGITDISLMEVARHCQKMSVINLNYCLHTTGFGLSCLLLNCQFLHDVKMSGCHSLKKVNLCKDNRFPDIPVASLNQSVHNETKPNECRCVKSVLVLKSDICEEIMRSHGEIKALYGITEERIVQTSRENILEDSVGLDCTQLEPFRVSSDHSWIQVLELYNCESLCDSDIIKICKYCPEIRSLNVGRNKNLSDTSVLAVARYLTLLTTLKIVGIDRLTNDSLAALAKTGLINLSLQACPKMTTAGLGDFLTTNKTLKKIEVCQEGDNIAEAFRSNNIENLLERISTEKVAFVLMKNPSAHWFNIEARRKS